MKSFSFIFLLILSVVHAQEITAPSEGTWEILETWGEKSWRLNHIQLDASGLFTNYGIFLGSGSNFSQTHALITDEVAPPPISAAYRSTSDPGHFKVQNVNDFAQCISTHEIKFIRKVSAEELEDAFKNLEGSLKGRWVLTRTNLKEKEKITYFEPWSKRNWEISPPPKFIDFVVSDGWWKYFQFGRGQTLSAAHLEVNYGARPLEPLYMDGPIKEIITGIQPSMAIKDYDATGIYNSGFVPVNVFFGFSDQGMTLSFYHPDPNNQRLYQFFYEKHHRPLTAEEIASLPGWTPGKPFETVILKEDNGELKLEDPVRSGE